MESSGTIRIAARWRQLAAAMTSALLAVGCVSASIVRVNGMTEHGKPLPVQAGEGDWQDAVKQDLARADAAPVIYPDSDVLSAIGGGILSIAYFGHDMGQKLLDQMIPDGWSQSGKSLEEACNPPADGSLASPEPESPYGKIHLGNPPDPAYTSTWTPFARNPDAALAQGTTCDANGNVTGAPAGSAFCGFGRLALQPENGKPLVIVLHGLFDSSSQIYVRQTGAILYSLGYSVFLMDLRDHGETFRKSRDVGWGLGDYEGADILRVARTLRGAGCGTRVSQVGAIGFSGGGLATTWAYLRDRSALSLGAVAVSPPLDLGFVLRRAEEGGSRRSCTVPRAINVTWPFYPLAGVIFGGIGAETGGLLAHDGERNTGAAVGAAIGAGVGLLAVGLLDQFGDGSPNCKVANNCIATTAIFNHFGDLMDQRWKTLFPGTPIPERSAIFGDYVKTRGTQYGAQPPRSATPELLRDAYQKAYPTPAPSAAHLLVVSSEDDPVVGLEPAKRLGELFAGARDVQVVIPRHGGHAAAILSNQAYARKALSDFWQAGLTHVAREPAPVPGTAPAKGGAAVPVTAP